jgi:hypothetical protein
MTSPTIKTPWILDRRNRWRAGNSGEIDGVYPASSAAVASLRRRLAACRRAPPPIHARGSLSITLTGSRWPGTDVSADLSLEIDRTITTDEDFDSLSITLALGGFRHDDDLTFNGEATSTVTLTGAVCALGPAGAIAFSAASANASFIPGQLTISADGVAQVTGFEATRSLAGYCNLTPRAE